MPRFHLEISRPRRRGEKGRGRLIRAAPPREHRRRLLVPRQQRPRVFRAKQPLPTRHQPRRVRVGRRQRRRRLGQAPGQLARHGVDQPRLLQAQLGLRPLDRVVDDLRHRPSLRLRRLRRARPGRFQQFKARHQQRRPHLRPRRPGHQPVQRRPQPAGPAHDAKEQMLRPRPLLRRQERIQLLQQRIHPLPRRHPPLRQRHRRHPPVPGALAHGASPARTRAVGMIRGGVETLFDKFGHNGLN